MWTKGHDVLSRCMILATLFRHTEVLLNGPMKFIQLKARRLWNLNRLDLSAQVVHLLSYDPKLLDDERSTLLGLNEGLKGYMMVWVCLSKVRVVECCRKIVNFTWFRPRDTTEITLAWHYCGHKKANSDNCRGNGHRRGDQCCELSKIPPLEHAPRVSQSSFERSSLNYCMQSG